jgi:hypothetical protein
MIKPSKHVMKRSQQRAIRQAWIELTLEYGREHPSFRDRAFISDDRALQRAPDHIKKLADKLRGLCVILTADQTLRTAFWSSPVRSKPGLLRHLRMAEVLV